MSNEQMRKDFEAWDSEQFDIHADLYSMNDGGYRDRLIKCRFHAWQAATLAERERCAKVCEASTHKMRLLDAFHNCKPIAPCELAAAIRKGPHE